MSRLLTAAFMALTCTLVPPAMAQEEGPAVPIEKAPYHLPVFTNEYVTVLNVYVPPQRNTGYHTHSRDSVSVNVEDADMTNQDLGQAQPGPQRLLHLQVSAAGPLHALITRRRARVRAGHGQ